MDDTNDPQPSEVEHIGINLVAMLDRLLEELADMERKLYVQQTTIKRLEDWATRVAEWGRRTNERLVQLEGPQEDEIVRELISISPLQTLGEAIADRALEEGRKLGRASALTHAEIREGLPGVTERQLLSWMKEGKGYHAPQPKYQPTLRAWLDVTPERLAELLAQSERWRSV